MGNSSKKHKQIHLNCLKAVTLIWIFLLLPYSIGRKVVISKYIFYFSVPTLWYITLVFLQYLCDLWLLSMLLSRLLRPPLQSISLGLNINSRDLLWIRSSSRSLSLIICCWAEQSSPSTLEDLFCFSVKWLMFPLMFWKNVKLGFLFWVFQKKLRGLDSAQNCSLKNLLKNS